MINGGDAAEQVIRLSLDGVEVVARISGEAAKNIAVLLAAVLKEEHKIKGKARLTNMIKSGKELKVFAIQNQDLKKFSKEAKRYGVLYCALKDKENNASSAAVDIIARAEDAAKIQRIMERFNLSAVNKGTVINSMDKERSEKFPKSQRTEKKNLSEKRLQQKASKEKGLLQNIPFKEKRDSVKLKLNKYREAEKRRNRKPNIKDRKGKNGNKNKEEKGR